jgi:PilZ domain-containing protein
LSNKPVETTLYSLSSKPPGRPERRSEERFLSLLRVGALRIGTRRELCLIRNISGGGMMIRPYSPIDPGTRVSVELKHGDSVSGSAQWSERGLVGITFDAPIDVLALLSASGMETQPRMPRIEVDCIASVREDADVHRSRALNISQGGICVQTDANLRIGAHVVVSLTGLAPAGGVVKWRDGDNYGIGFNRVFPVGELMCFLQQKKNAERKRATG